MKKLIFLIFIISATSLHSQFLKGYGVKLGGTLSHQTFKFQKLGFDFINDKKLGFNVGVFAELFDLPFISFISEINYIQKGFQCELFKTSIDDNTSELIEESDLWKVRLDYINISLLAKTKIEFGIVNPYLIVGPRIDFEVGHSSNIPMVSGVYDDYNKNLFGLKMGLGSELEVWEHIFLAEVLYDLNFSDLKKTANVEVKAYSIDFRIGIYF